MGGMEQAWRGQVPKPNGVLGGDTGGHLIWTLVVYVLVKINNLFFHSSSRVVEAVRAVPPVGNLGMPNKDRQFWGNLVIYRPVEASVKLSMDLFSFETVYAVCFYSRMLVC